MQERLAQTRRRHEVGRPEVVPGHEVTLIGDAILGIEREPEAIQVADDHALRPRTVRAQNLQDLHQRLVAHPRVNDHRHPGVLLGDDRRFEHFALIRMNRGRKSDLADDSRFDRAIADAVEELADHRRRQLVDRRRAQVLSVRLARVPARPLDDRDARALADLAERRRIAVHPDAAHLEQGPTPGILEPLHLRRREIDVDKAQIVAVVEGIVLDDPAVLERHLLLADLRKIGVRFVVGIRLVEDDVLVHVGDPQPCRVDQSSDGLNPPGTFDIGRRHDVFCLPSCFARSRREQTALSFNASSRRRRVPPWNTSLGRDQSRDRDPRPARATSDGGKKNARSRTRSGAAEAIA